MLTHLLNKALDWGWISHLPTRVRKYKEPQGRIDYLQPHEITTLLSAAKEDYHPYIYPFMLIALETSMRRMEVLSIRLADIYLDRLLIYLPQAKAGAREQPITPHLAEYLREYISGHPEPN